ncbi:hypothetical protein [Actinomadura litoris]|uniref:WD40 repeat domain-containing protein n=1 Tax=Actinomadura litoris TaxID=2678616 RepID=A0A7K1KWZ4_9ACTN|nr:hypothetical protein [Actinomadura litoris]MUN36722.1 hypothetical protein [Actinomadura litoris]
MTTDLENRLRNTFHAATADVRDPAEPEWEPVRSRRRLVPVLGVAAAVAATVMVAFGIGLVRDEAPRAGQPFSAATGGATPVRPARSPAFALQVGYERELRVVDVATGEARGAVLPPPGYPVLWAGHAAMAADNRTVFFTVRKTADGPWMVARAHLDDRGRLDARAVVVAQAPGSREVEAAAPNRKGSPTASPAPWAEGEDIAVSPDATRLAMVVSSKKATGISVWDLRTGKSAVWGSPVAVTALAWGEDGSLLWASDRSSGRLDPRSKPDVLRPTRSFADDGEPLRAKLLPNGDRIVVRTMAGVRLLVRMPGGSGRLERTLDRWNSNGASEASVAVDGGGGHVLYSRDGEWVRMDLKTGKRVPAEFEGLDMKTARFVW